MSYRPFGAKSAQHRGIPTSEPRDSFARFCQIQRARANSRGASIVRAYVERLIALSQEGATYGDLIVRRKGFTYGGSPSHRGVIPDDSA